VTAELYFLLMVIGLPVLILGLALAAARFYHDGPEELLDWKPTRSPRREAELYGGDTHDMLGAINRYRRLRGAPDRSLEEVTEHSWADLDQYD